MFMKRKGLERNNSIMFEIESGSTFCNLLILSIYKQDYRAVFVKFYEAICNHCKIEDIFSLKQTKTDFRF